MDSIPSASSLPAPNSSSHPSPGPSFALTPAPTQEQFVPAPAQAHAPERPLPQVSYYSIEYPGYVQPTPASVTAAIRSVGGQAKIDKVFKQRADAVNANSSASGGAGASGSGTAGGTASASGTGNVNTTRLLELRWAPDNPFVHPVPGEVGAANNLVLRVVKRRRKKRDRTNALEEQRNVEVDANGTPYVGEFKAEVVGIMSKTARFRSMADFQFLPDPQDPVSKLRSALDNMDVDTLCAYRIPPEPVDDGSAPPATLTPLHGSGLAPTAVSASMPAPMDVDVDMNLDPLLREISRTSSPSAPAVVPPAVPSTSHAPSSFPSPSGLRLFPPPLFSRQAIPQGYNFKANTASMISTTVDEATGEERKRLINRMRWKGYGPASIVFADNYVPQRAPAAVEVGRDQVSQTILQKLQQAFVDRPIWTRMSLFNQFTPAEARDIINSKILLPLCCYVFQDGPWRDTLIRFSYDPRKDPSSRFYQRLYFRNANHPISRPSVTSRRQDRTSVTDQLRMQEKDTERKTSHIFDGKTVTKETAAFQLCDITDAMLKSMIDDPEALRETCNERDGWYTTHAFEQIKTVLRHKFFSVLEGHIVTDEECRILLETTEGSVKASLAQRNSRLRAGKHNMAKGALRPEDAAAMRLRATLDRSMKSFQSQRS